MIKDDMLDALSDEDIHAVKALADKVLKFRDDERKTKAIEDARAMLAAAGLTFTDVVKRRLKPQSKPQYRGGVHYQHPVNKAQVWNAKGQKPNWLRDLESEGKKPVEVPANDDSFRKAG